MADPRPTTGVLTHDGGEAMELGGGDVAAIRLDVDHEVAILFLGFHVSLSPFGIVCTVVVIVSRVGRQCRRSLLQEFFNIHVGFRVNWPNFFELGFYQGLELVDTNPIDQDFQTGHHPVLSQHVGVIEHGEQGQGQSEYVFLR